MMRGSTLIRLRRALMAHSDQSGREGGVAMLTAILFIIIMAGISTIILGVVTAQTIPSYLDQKGTKTIYSAQAGIEAALSILRSASTKDAASGNYFGDPTKVPCSLSSTTNGQSDGNSYSVTINYFTSDPTGQSATWIAANKLACTTGTAANYGVSGKYGLTTVPKYALITSAGGASQIPEVSGQANRSITALYTFKVSNANILGGLIYNRDGTACLQAVKSAAGQQIQFVAASSCSITGTNAALQLWSYTTNWQIALSSTEVSGAVTTASLCITGPTSYNGATQNVKIQSCAKSTASASSRFNQLWSWTGAYTWEGESSNSSISGPNGNAWLSPPVADGTSPVGKYLEVVNASGPVGTMDPTAQVGAGAAAYSTHQIVNYLEFGRCTDVTNEDLSQPAMISYPCKQDPTGGTTYITWNQLWYYCEVGDTSGSCKTVNAAAQQIYVLYNNSTSSKYCLTTPLTSAGNLFPYFTTCATTGTLKSQQTWDRVYAASTYLGSYLFIDTYGRCLEANSSDIFGTGISELTASSCNGDDSQKWNAPAAYVDSSVGGYREISGG
jgi:hypothetical protein